MKKTVKFKPTRPHTAEQWVAGEGAPSGKEPQVAMKRFTIDVPVELHTRIKVAAPAGARRWPICFGSFWSVNSQNRNCGFTIYPTVALSLRLTRIEASPAFAGLEDWDVLDDGKPVGRIYEKHVPARPDLAWFWSITGLSTLAALPPRWTRRRLRLGQAGIAGAHGRREPGSTGPDHERATQMPLLWRARLQSVCWPVASIGTTCRANCAWQSSRVTGAVTAKAMSPMCAR